MAEQTSYSLAILGLFHSHKQAWPACHHTYQRGLMGRWRGATILQRGKKVQLLVGVLLWPQMTAGGWRTTDRRVMFTVHSHHLKCRDVALWCSGIDEI